MAIRLKELLDQAAQYNEYFGAFHATVQETLDQENLKCSFWVGYKNDTGYIYSGSGDSLDKAILNTIMDKEQCSIQEAQEIFNQFNIKQEIV